MNGKSVLHKNGYAKLTKGYDEHGNETKIDFFDINGNPTVDEYGVSVIHITNDKCGKKMQRELFGMAGYALRSSPGVFRCLEKYSEAGKVIEESFFSEDGNPMMGIGGYATGRRTYDVRGNVTEEAYYGVDGNPILNKQGYAKIVWNYDDRDVKTSQICFGVDQKIVSQMNKPIPIAIVTSVAPNKAAEQQGILVGDIILEWGDWRYNVDEALASHWDAMNASKERLQSLNKVLVFARVRGNQCEIFQKTFPAGRLGIGYNTVTCIEDTKWVIVEKAYLAWLKSNSQK